MVPDSADKLGVLPRLLAWATRIAIARPGVTLAWVAVSCVVCVAWSLAFLKFKTDRSDLIDHRADFHQRWLKFAEEFGESSDAIVVVESSHPAAIRAALDDVGRRLEAEPDSFTRVQWKFDPAVLRAQGLQFLPPPLLANAVSQLRNYAPILKSGRWNLVSLPGYGERLALHLADAVQRQDGRAVQADLVQTALLAESLAGFMQDPQSFRSPWPEVIPAEAGGEMAQIKVHYNLNERGTMGFILAVPTGTGGDFSGGSPSLKRLREIIQESQTDHPDVTLGLTGIPVLEADEMAKSQEDMLLASVLAFLGVAVLMVLGFRSLRHPLISLVMLIVGMCWTMGFITVAIGHLNILSVSFATILIGMGIDFGVHFLERYLACRHTGMELQPAIIKTSLTTGPGIVTCALSTSLAFFCAGVTSFLGVSELGIIAGGGVLLCALAAFFVLPPLLCLVDRHVSEAKLPQAFAGTPLRFVTHRFPVAIVVLTVIGFIVMMAMGIGQQDGHYVSRVKYDMNLLNLQARGVASVELQHRVFEQSEGSLLYAVSVADSPESVRQLRDRFLALPTVGRVEELASLMPKYPLAETQVYIVQLQDMLSNVAELPEVSPSDPESVGRGLEKLYLAVKDLRDPSAQRAAQALDLFLDTLTALPIPQQIELLTGYQQAMQIALHTQFQLLSQVTDTRPVVDSLPDPLRSRFISSQGNWMLRVYPKQQIWDEEPLTAFVNDIRSIDPEATGTPLQNFEAANQIRASYQHAAILACAMIMFVLLVDLLPMGPLLLAIGSPLVVVGFALSSPGTKESLGLPGIGVMYIVLVFLVAAIFEFGSIGKALLIMLPPLGGGLMTFGTLALLKTDLNPANMIVLPLLLGIGVDCGIFVVHDFLAQAPGTYRISSSIINAILLTSTSTMVGFGTMIISSHYGLSSLGLVLTVGVANCLFISLVPLPALLTLLDRTRAKGAMAVAEETSGEHATAGLNVSAAA